MRAPGLGRTIQTLWMIAEAFGHLRGGAAAMVLIPGLRDSIRHLLKQNTLKSLRGALLVKAQERSRRVLAIEECLNQLSGLILDFKEASPAELAGCAQSVLQRGAVLLDHLAACQLGGDTERHLRVLRDAFRMLGDLPERTEAEVREILELRTRIAEGTADQTVRARLFDLESR